MSTRADTRTAEQVKLPQTRSTVLSPKGWTVSDPLWPAVAYSGPVAAHLPQPAVRAEALHLGTSSEPVAEALATAADGPLPVAYRTLAAPVHETVELNGPWDLRILDAGRFVAYFSAGEPRYARYQMGSCIVEFDYGIDGSRVEALERGSRLRPASGGEILMVRNASDTVRLTFFRTCAPAEARLRRVDGRWSLSH